MDFIAGILLILIGIAHNIYGEKKQIPDLKAISNDSIMIGSLRVMIFQGGILLMAVGIIQLLLAISLIQLTGFAAYFPVGIVFLNFCTFLLITIFIHNELLKITLPQLIVFIVIIILQFLSV